MRVQRPIQELWLRPGPLAGHSCPRCDVAVAVPLQVESSACRASIVTVPRGEFSVALSGAGWAGSTRAVRTSGSFNTSSASRGTPRNDSSCNAKGVCGRYAHGCVPGHLVSRNAAAHLVRPSSRTVMRHFNRPCGVPLRCQRYAGVEGEVGQAPPQHFHHARPRTASRNAGWSSPNQRGRPGAGASGSVAMISR